MLRRLRETAPVALVPLAWAFVAATHFGVAGDTAALVAHLVMDACLVGFLALSWSDMAEGVLRVWRTVILLGVPVTLVGTAGLWADLGPLPLLVSLVGWMVLPAPALWQTASASAAAGDDAAALVNRAAAVTTLGGAVVYVGTLSVATGGATEPTLALALSGVALVGLGQTAGIVDAAVRY